MAFVGALDQGTTSTRFLVVDGDGREVARRQVEHRQILPAPGWVEHDPLEIAAAAGTVIAAGIAAAGLTGDALTAIGITNQRETIVVWDPVTGKPWHNAIVWQDARTAGDLGALAPRRDDLVARTGLPPTTYSSSTKLRWILDHVAGVRDAARDGRAIAGTIDTWLVWTLTGGPDGGRHVTDVTNASRTQLMDLRTLDWDESLLALFDIPRAMLPAVARCTSTTAFGRTRASGPCGAEVPITAVLGDQHAALVGQAGFATGDVKNTYGTGNFLLLNTGAGIVRSTAGLLTTVAYAFGGPGGRAAGGSADHEDAPLSGTAVPRHPPSSPAQGTPSAAGPGPVYALEGSIAVTGAAVQWLRDQLGLVATAADVEVLAGSVPDAAGLYFVPAFSGLFAPYWRPDARGAIVGLSRFHTKAHLARATLDAICFQTRDVLDAMTADAGVRPAALKVDGGATVNGLLMQLQADVLGVPVVRPAVTETTALGAALAAGLAAGVWPDLAALRRLWRVDRVFAPAWSADQRDAAYAGWRKAVLRSLDWVV